jgi:hypothetical protein
MRRQPGALFLVVQGRSEGEARLRSWSSGAATRSATAPAAARQAKQARRCCDWREAGPAPRSAGHRLSRARALWSGVCAPWSAERPRWLPLILHDVAGYMDANVSAREVIGEYLAAITNQPRWSSSSQSRRSGGRSIGWSRSQLRKFWGMPHLLPANERKPGTEGGSTGAVACTRTSRGRD